MRILVVGGGGREHALVWKLAESPRCERLYCAPGNAGIGRVAECINLKPADVEGLANFAATERVDLTVVGPETPLIAGIVDRFEARGLPIFGPATDPARIEGSKAFSKELMLQYGIPTAAYRRCDSTEAAREYLHEVFSAASTPEQVVIKADGAAAGKGVSIVRGEEAARAEVDRMMVERAFGEAGDRIVIEEFLEGDEVSLMGFTDGETIVPMLSVQDHKRVFDNDGGPNTGGMGAYAPVHWFSHAMVQEALERVMRPAVAAVRDLGIPYKGVLYAGLILTKSGMKTLEFNCRFGDPETQAILPLLETDLVTVLEACVNNALDEVEVRWKPGAAACVVASSGGYPGEYASGKLIEGLDRAGQEEGCHVFHAGTRMENGQFLTDGGRVLGVTGTGPDLGEALQRAYAGMDCIRFEGMHFRRDIGKRSLGN